MAHIDGDPTFDGREIGAALDEAQSVVDLTTAPPQVRPRREPGVRPEPGSGRDDESAHDDRADRVGRPRHRGGQPAIPLLRMVRAAVGRAAEGSSGDGPDREASAS